MRKVQNDRNESGIISIIQIYLSDCTILNKLSLKELIDEVGYEQDNNISWKNQKLRPRVIDFRKFLLIIFSIVTLDKYLGWIKVNKISMIVCKNFHIFPKMS